MAATTTTTTTTLATTTTGNSSTINNNNNHHSSSNSSSNNHILTVHTVLNTPTSIAVAAAAAGAADAATVAIAKDMLQLHHGAAAVLNNNNNSSSSGAGGINNSELTAASSNNNNNNSANHPPATTSSSVSASVGGSATTPPYGELRFNQEVLPITDTVTVIGRNSSTSLVHFNVAENNLVSRKHFQVLYDLEVRAFFVQCLSKNGIFVDDFLQRRNVDPMRLPPRCYFRFPSTEIRIEFESYVAALANVVPDAASSPALATVAATHAGNNHNAIGSTGAHVIITPPPRDDLQQQQHHHHSQQQQHQPAHHLLQQQQQQHQQQPSLLPLPLPHAPLHPLHHSALQQQQQRGGNVVVVPQAAPAHLISAVDGTGIYAPLKISIPKKEQKSPYLSPTGTISAANSCPASPRQGFHQNQPNNYNNYSNNNTVTIWDLYVIIMYSFDFSVSQQDLFQTPSTASYNHNEKPPYSYAQLIVQAISAAPDKQLTLSGIYSFIVKHYPYYRKETNKGWQNSIRHNLSLNRYFIKVARSQDEPGKGSFWRIDPDSGAKLIDHSYKKRRQRSSQGFRPPYGMPRSAPVSPSHMDNSRESSPLQDIVLQSAPGSPGMSMEQRAADAEIIYNSQNAHQQQQHQQQQQQQTLSNNSNQYSSGSPYYVSNQNSGVAVQQAHTEGGGNAGGVGALIALKRNHVTAGGPHPTTATLHHQQQAAVQQQQQHQEIIYEELPTDYSGHIEASEEECVTTADATVAKRPKYVSEVL
ncbi:forkhead box protein K2 isoform X1 [Drosophila pseudoobscura]|uniref:Forkhead box protein K2 isoform X1 n=1 Tax=Drosophila pseudoobscura pseudoobscura TaxID=46245 RepID=A0A6I8W920_DROPS|nr:forkhead box protein K2 isoform X1 [Drosophila pseudoobscura]XP_033239114.1 forkhead box protein K2 isoform X1 [Drosophila pseudoobscura]